MAGIRIENLINENSLVFSSLDFLFWFLPLFLVLFLVTPKKAKHVTLFLFSILLYAMCEPVFVLLLLGMTAVNYLFGRGLQMKNAVPVTGNAETETGKESGAERDSLAEENTLPGTAGRRRMRQLLFVTAAVCNILPLVLFKAGNVLSENILLPIGISFYTFKSLSYLIDVYQNQEEAEHSFFRFGAWLCMFPQIASGPIMRYECAREGMLYGQMTWENFEDGLRKLILGLGAKVLLADRIGILWNDLQMIGFESISTPAAWLGILAYSLQLYFDFGGYSLMAVGIGEMLGFPVIKNFDQPYSASSVGEFYRRWHMTLGSWFRDYIYIPLGGNRKGTGRLIGNLLFVWLLTGLWHGNSVNFLIWGILVGLFIVAEKLFLGSWLKKHKIAAHVYVLFLIPLTWAVFAIPDLKELGIYFSRLFPFFRSGEAVNGKDVLKLLSNYGGLLTIGILCCIPALSDWYDRHRTKWYMTAALAVLFWTAVYFMANAVNNPFLYFQF